MNSSLMFWLQSLGFYSATQHRPICCCADHASFYSFCRRLLSIPASVTAEFSVKFLVLVLAAAPMFAAADQDNCYLSCNFRCRITKGKTVKEAKPIAGITYPWGRPKTRLDFIFKKLQTLQDQGICPKENSGSDTICLLNRKNGISSEAGIPFVTLEIMENGQSDVLAAAFMTKIRAAAEKLRDLGICRRVVDSKDIQTARTAGSEEPSAVK